MVSVTSAPSTACTTSAASNTFASPDISNGTVTAASSEGATILIAALSAVAVATVPPSFSPPHAQSVPARATINAVR